MYYPFTAGETESPRGQQRAWGRSGTRTRGWPPGALLGSPHRLSGPQFSPASSADRHHPASQLRRRRRQSPRRSPGLELSRPHPDPRRQLACPLRRERPHGPEISGHPGRTALHLPGAAAAGRLGPGRTEGLQGRDNPRCPSPPRPMGGPPCARGGRRQEVTGRQNRGTGPSQRARPL